MKKFWREPFLHFLLLGLGVFLFYGWVQGDTTDDQEIVLDNSDLKQMISKWNLQWKRLPSEDELTGVVEHYLRQEVLYKEALALNLDHNDEIIKRRLSQKMDFLSGDLAQIASPTEAELGTYFETHAARYRLPFSYSFEQIAFTRDKSGDHLSKNATETLARLQSRPSSAPAITGDPLSVPRKFNAIDGTRLASQMGDAFEKAMQTAAMDTWTGPIASGFGVHLVKISQRKNPQMPHLDQVRSEVLRDYQYDKEKEIGNQLYLEIRKKYPIQIELEPFDAINQEFIDQLEQKISE
ncbi:peptidyl-prolyl cis-trans isomerase [Sediminicola luteus]|uniref:PpiC domain-containing protein n=1 Tax=Sediminicola luteus TaxID=319238 RepID=A0A2A4GE42_9FLAO|nr:peptidylprolyl isomerase [Sediminicola luteus]PCE66250.1 hypothetical protein B7P33_02830 [Sediminicola luteus]